jgi:hypothetical protein
MRHVVSSWKIETNLEPADFSDDGAGDLNAQPSKFESGTELEVWLRVRSNHKYRSHYEIVFFRSRFGRRIFGNCQPR